jgi:capsular exopolysaccharide synthesis family protein
MRKTVRISKAQNDKSDAGRLLYYQNPFFVKESYRSARTNLMFLPRKEGHSCRIFAITSANAGEGKSTNCANLAIAIAQNDKRVLFIDCDMRKPKVHTLMDIEETPGLSEYLAGIETELKVHESRHTDKFFIVSAGAVPPNPTELLSSSSMKKLLESESENYDYILLDTPPVNMVADSLVLKSLIDGYILVVRANKTNQNDLDQAMARLEQVDAHCLGFILNDVNPKSGGYGRYGKYGHYGHYGHGYDYDYGYAGSGTKDKK